MDSLHLMEIKKFNILVLKSPWLVVNIRDEQGMLQRAFVYSCSDLGKFKGYGRFILNDPNMNECQEKRNQACIVVTPSLTTVLKRSCGETSVST